MRRNEIVVEIILIALGLFVSGSILFMIVGSLSDRNEAVLAGKRVGLVELYGTIDGEASSVVSQLERHKEDRSVKAVVIRIDSPGGGVAASQEIYEQVGKVRKAGKPVVISMAGVAASGGYYVSCGADSIVANPGTLTGSIGVIMSYATGQELLKKLGLRFEVVKSGKFKDTGAIYRSPTPEERKYLVGIMDDVYDQFVDAVATGRKLERMKVLSIADGRVFTGRQALSLGLVDKMGDLDDAIRVAGRMAGIKGKPAIVRKIRRKPSLFDLVRRFFEEETVVRRTGLRLEYRME
ncbi:MAG: signal peptide peptidase SppA [Candidatus Eisenbacteria bacterium]|nr:signal peptide peptidase SppA [Candidatus Eisenbacteria bacterium]